MKQTIYGLRIEVDLKKAAQDYANKTGRTLPGLIKMLLRNELEKAGK